MLRNLKRVFIQFSPTDPRATAARELLQRLGCDKARKSNPDCVVEFHVDEAGQAGSASVLLSFVDGQETELMTADMRAEDVLRLISEKATEMELRSVMNEVKYDPFKEENRIRPPPL